MGKRYWWLKLQEDFFRQIEIKKLRKIAGGDTYTVIYLKMMLLSLKNEGRIAYDCSEGEFVENLALDIDEDEENVAVTVAFLQKHGLLIGTDSESEITLPKAAEAIGSETAAASRMRDMRNRKKAGKCVLVRRDTREKIECSLDQVEDEVLKLLNLMQSEMLERARAHRDSHTYVAKNMDEFEKIFNEKSGFVKAMWCGNQECEDAIKEKLAVTSRCMPFEQETITDTCVCCGKPATKMVYWGRAY